MHRPIATYAITKGGDYIASVESLKVDRMVGRTLGWHRIVVDMSDSSGLLEVNDQLDDVVLSNRHELVAVISPIAIIDL
jgi:hypothetical protein